MLSSKAQCQRRQQAQCLCQLLTQNRHQHLLWCQTRQRWRPKGFMKISPVPSSANIAPAPIDQSSGSAVQNYRSIRMQTNATPQEYDFQGSQPGQPPISAPNETGQAGVAEETQPISPQFAALARQRRALQVKERALADRERALQGQSGQTDSIALARLK